MFKNFKTYILFLICCNFFNFTLAQDIEYGQCGTHYEYYGNPGYTKELIYEIPPNQPKGVKVYEYFSYHMYIPDGVKIYIDGNLIDEVWVGYSGESSVHCTANGDGKTEKTCRKGPVEWSNENNPNGAGVLSDMTAQMSSKDIINTYKSEGVWTDPYPGYPSPITGILHLKLYTTENICQIKFVIISSKANTTFWQSKLKCPTLSCPTSLPVKIENQCNTVKLSTDICEGFRKNLKWTSKYGNYFGSNVEVKKPDGVNNIDFSLDAKFSNQCELHQNVNVSFQELINLNTKSEQTTCPEIHDGSASVVSVKNGQAPYKYEWKNHPGANSATLSGLAPGIYTVKVTDAKGCDVEKNISVVSGEPIKVDLVSDNVKCFGDETGSINSSISQNHGAVSFDWSNGSKEKDLKNLKAGQYRVTVKDEKGCSATETATITQPNSPLKIDFESFGTACENSKSGKIELKMKGGTAPYKMDYQGNVLTGDKQTIKELTEGDYDFKVTDANGCSEKVSVNVPYDPAMLNGELTTEGCDVRVKLTLINSRNGVIALKEGILGKGDFKEISLDDNNYTHLGLNFEKCSFEGDFKLNGNRPAQKSEIFIPNTFSPNNDGVNDRFSFFTKYTTDVKSFGIYDRWGNQIYYVDNIGAVTGDSYQSHNIGWDGTFKGENVNSGVYVYVLEFPCGEISSDVTLIR